MVKNKNKNKNKPNKNGNIPRLQGQGDYYSDKILPFLRENVPTGTFSKYGSNLGGKGGSLAGSKFGLGKEGNTIGQKLGGFLGGGISKILGFGDYTVVSNSLIKSGMALPPGESVPAFGVMGNETRVTHREFISDISGVAPTSLFLNRSYTINPGDVTTFPWLSAIAQSYQEYKFNGIVFEFKTLSSDISAGGSLGAVIMATEYNVLDPSFTDKLRMENAQFSVSAKPSQSQIHTVECNPRESANNVKYVRNSRSAAGDNRLYDLGKFQLATAGLAAAADVTLGELWVSYDVSLYKPVITNDVLVVIYSMHVTPTAGVDDTHIFGTARTTVENYTFASISSTAIGWEVSEEFMITLQVAGTGLVTPTLTTTCTYSLINVSYLTNATGAVFAWRISALAGTSVSFDVTACTTFTACELRVAPYAYATG